MDDFKIIARLLATIRAGEDEAVFPLALIGEGVLRTPVQRICRRPSPNAKRSRYATYQA